MDAREAFLSYLNTLDENYYFFIANNILGKIPTPFHKPVLNQRILSFLLNEDNRKNIRSSIDCDERRYLSLLLIAGEASSKQIQSFFPSDSYPMVVTRMCGLKDRLVILFSEGTYRINPVLEDIVTDVFDAALLFGENKGKIVSEPFADRNVLSAYLNLLISGAVPVREANTHHFVKSDRLEKVFPQFGKAQSTCMFTLIKDLALREKVVSIRETRFILLDRKRSEVLLGLDPLCLVTKAVHGAQAKVMSRILGVLRKTAIPEESLVRFYSILSGEDEETSAQILEDISAFGIICKKDGFYYLNQAIHAEKQKQSHLNIDSDMEVSYFGIPDENDILFIFADIKVCDKLIRYSLTKSSFTRALELGLSRNQIQSYLGIQDNEQLKLWESSFSRITLYDGIVIRGDELISRIIRMHPEMKRHVICELSDGVFLMERSSYHIWQEILAHAIDMPHLPLPLSNAEVEDHQEEISKEKPPVFELPKSHSSESGENWKEIEKDLLSYAEQNGCTSDTLKELIRSRLIVSRSQIGKDCRYASMPSASGFDYNAKLSIIRASLKSQKDEGAPLLRLELPEETIIAQPIEILKGNSNSSVLKARVLPDGIDRSIPVSSIYKVTVLRWILS